MFTKLAILLLASTTAAQTSTPTPGPLPSLTPLFPSRTPDPTSCASKNLSSLVDPPVPTRALWDVYTSQVRKVDCETKVSTAFNLSACATVNKSSWCAYVDDPTKPQNIMVIRILTTHSITTAIPTSLSSVYDAYGSSIASWWSAHGAELSSVKKECPNRWDHVNLVEAPLIDAYLDVSKVLGQCWSEKNAENITSGASVAPLATTGSGVEGPASTGAASRAFAVGLFGVGTVVAGVLV